MKAVSMAPSMMVCATWIPAGPSSQAMLGAGEGGEAGAAAHARRRPGEEDRAVAARRHHLRRFAPHQEPGEAAHLPHLEIDPARRLADGKADIGADIEYRHLDRPGIALDALNQLFHLLFLARIDAEGDRLAAGAADRLHQRRQLLAVAADDARDEAFAREAPGDGAAEGVAGADHQRDLLLHGPSPHDTASDALRWERPSTASSAK